MDELTVIGAENGALIVVSADGARFRVPITEALHTALRQNRPAAPAAHRVPPREIQALIRQGLTAQQVAEQTGEPLEYIQRFEGPVLAEREYVVTAARTVPVAVAAELEAGTTGTFGSVIDRRLSALGARDVRWESRKADTHWLVSVSFLDGETARTATWTFDPKKSALAPVDHEAHSLSQQGDAATPVLPRLRAVMCSARHWPMPDVGRHLPRCWNRTPCRRSTRPWRVRPCATWPKVCSAPMPWPPTGTPMAICVPACAAWCGAAMR